MQDEIARKIAEALRVTLTPQEQAALAAKPTENLQAYDLYLRGKSYARRLTRQDLEFALQMFENAVALDPGFALAYAAIANVCAQHHYRHGRDPAWIGTGQGGRRSKADRRCGPSCPRSGRQAWVLYAGGQYEDAVRRRAARDRAQARLRGRLLPARRALFAAGRYQEMADIAEAAIESAARTTTSTCRS